MNTPPLKSDDDPLDRHLRSGLRRTSGEFEARFERIRFQPQEVEASPRVPSRNVWRPLLPWATLGAAAVFTLLAWFFLNPASEDPHAPDWTEHSVYLEDPLYWDQALDSARVILQDDLLEAIVFLSYENHDI